MSIPVALDRLADALEAFGAGYLLTASPDGRVKALTVEPTVAEGALVVGGDSPGTAANLDANPRVTLVFPPVQPKGFSLIVDGTGEVVGGGFRVSPATAVLHRPAAHRDGPPAPEAVIADSRTACGDDCHPL